MDRPFIVTLACAALVSWLPATAVATVTTVWVGADNALCNTSSLTNAITNASTAAGDTTQIDVADDQAYGGLLLDLADRNIDLTGGYAHCGDSSPVERTHITAPHGQRVMTIGSSSGSRQVTLSNLYLSGGVVSSGDGGGLAISGPVTVTLSNGLVADNSATYGGGIYIAGSVSDQPALILTDNTRIGQNASHFNSATYNGGGIACSNALLSLDGSSILFNTAGSYGGGLELFNCGVYSGGTFSDDNLIESNQATTGAGIFATNGSSIQFGASGGQTSISGNSAGGDGGGVYLSGAATQVTMSAAHFLGNMAGGNGGGAYVNGATFQLDRGDSDLLCPATPCAYLSGNAAADGFAVYATSGALVNLARLMIAGPNTSLAMGSVLHGDGASTIVGLYGVLMTALPGAAGVQLLDGATADVSNLTLSGDSLAEDFDLATADTELDITDSIVWDAPATAVSGSGTLLSTDNDSHETGTLPGSGFDPGFVDAANFDFHLRADSLNVDAYSVNSGTPATDIDGTPRPVDLYPDNGGVYDRGAYELGDEIFGDGFNGP